MFKCKLLTYIYIIIVNRQFTSVNNVKGKFMLENDFPKTTHMILMEKPHEVAESIKKFMKL